MEKRMTSYTLEDLAQARQNLARLQEKWSNDTSNNPNKYRSDLQIARAQVEMIEQELKAEGIIPLTEKEKLELELDQRFPHARSKEIVEYDGRRYRRRFYPRERSRSRKTITLWGKYWEPLDDS
jgi:hypothetical protein